MSDVPSVPDAGVPWSGGGATVAEAPTDNGDAPGSETGKQSPAETFGQFNVAAPTERFSKDAMTEPLTGMLDSVGLREEEQKRRVAELLRRREEEEGRLREAQERERREAEERRRRELEERQSKQTVEHVVPAALASQPQAASQAQQQSAAQSQQQPGVGVQPQYQHAGVGQVPYTPTVTEQKRSRAPFIVLGVAALLLLIGFGALAYFVVLPRLFGENTNVNVNINANTNTANANADTNANVNTNTNANTNANANGTNEPVRADLVALPAGTFKMGRSDVPPITDALKTQRPAYLLWMYNQWPAHDTPVGAFAIDRTEVTNAEYAEFVKATSHAPPPDWAARLRPRAASVCPSRTSPSTTRTRSPRGARDGTASSTDSRKKKNGSTPRSAAARRRFRARPRRYTRGACSGLPVAEPRGRWPRAGRLVRLGTHAAGLGRHDRQRVGVDDEQGRDVQR